MVPQSCGRGRRHGPNPSRVLLRSGDGVQKDSAEAVGWWHRAAKQGNTEAQMLLGLAYASAEGVQKDYVQAYKWLSLVSSNPAAKSEQANEAASFRDELADEMTATQIAEAQKLAREWEPKTERP